MIQHPTPSEHWRLCDDVTVVQAALLIINVDPAGVQERVFDTDSFETHAKPGGFDTVFSALKNAINSGKIKPTRTVKQKRMVRTEDNEGAPAQVEIETGSINWSETTIAIKDLKEWLIGKKIKSGFLFPEGMDGKAAYLDSSHPHYAPKLAAAVMAWLAINQDSNALRTKTPKHAAEAWLRAHATEFNLIWNGSVNNDAILEISKIVNWKGGGPLETPTVSAQKTKKS